MISRSEALVVFKGIIDHAIDDLSIDQDICNKAEEIDITENRAP